MLGLGIGIACCILITLFIYDDLGYDAYNRNSKQIYKIKTEVNNNESIQCTDHTPAPLKMVLKEEVPEINNVVRFSGVQEYTTIEYKNKEFRNPKIILADHEIFDLLDFTIGKSYPFGFNLLWHFLVPANRYLPWIIL